MSGTKLLEDTAVEGAELRGITVGGTAQAMLTGYRSCGDTENLWINDNVQTEVDDTSEIYEDEPPEKSSRSVRTPPFEPVGCRTFMQTHLAGSS